MRYGDDKTIHRTGHVDVEVDQNGEVVAVWFRCLTLPFKATRVSDGRADELRKLGGPDIAITAVEFEEKPVRNNLGQAADTFHWFWHALGLHKR